MSRFVVQERPLSPRPFAVVDGLRVVELHRDLVSAVTAARRLNGACVQCGVVLPAHAPGCFVADFDPDPDFGADYDEAS